MRLCKSLEQVFNGDLDFEITWCRFRYFSDPAVASEAAEVAADADVILVSTPSAEDLPLEVKAWFERWLPNRKASEGAIVLLQSSEQPLSSTISESPYLYLLARRANLDFISLSNAGAWASTDGIPQNLLRPRSLGTDFNRNSRHNSHSGINE
jgi:hypothetical protein